MTKVSVAQRLRTWLSRSLSIILSLLAAIAVGSLLMLWYKRNPLEIYLLLFKGAFGTQRSIFISLQRATPLIFTALGASLAFKAGVFNIGVEGQFFIGAIAGTYVGYAFKLPTIIHLPLALLTGFLAGALWALVPVLMRQKLGISEIISTIMTNYIAMLLIAYLTNYPMRESPITDQTPPVQKTAVLPQFIELTGRLGKGTQAHVGIFIAIVVVVVMYFILKRTKIGYEWRMVGLSFPFSEFGGINLTRAFITAMLVSGGLAGLGGSVEILGVWRKYKNNFATGYGFRGNLAALLGRQNIIGSAIAALFYGSMEAGAMGLDWAAGVPRQLIDILVNLIIFFMAAEGIWDFVKRIKWVRGAELVRRTTGELEV